MKITDAVRSLKGVGDKTEKSLNKLGIFTIEDLIEFYPRGYQSYEAPVYLSDAVPEKRQAIIGYLHRELVRIPVGRVEKTSGTSVHGSAGIFADGGASSKDAQQADPAGF